MSLEIRPVRSNADLRRFITCVWDIYKGDPYWVPPVIADRKKLLDREKNPFYKHAEMEMFLAWRDGKVVGRIAAIVNRAHNEAHGDDVGFFGFFESIDDRSVAHALFAEAERWLLARGLGVMRGPVNPSMNDEAGLLIDGFDDPPMILTTYNPKYYSALIESFGFTKAKDLYAWKLTESFLSPKLERVRNAVMTREKLVVRNFNFSPKSAFWMDVEVFHHIYNTAWEKNWGMVKMTREEIDFMAKDLRTIAARDLVLIVESAGEPVGFVLALPDINQALIKNRSGGLLSAAYHLLFGKKRINRARIVALGVVPAFQRRGIDAALYYEVGTRVIRDHKYVGGEASWILEDNEMMNRAAEMMNGEIYKRYRIFDKTMNKN